MGDESLPGGSLEGFFYGFSFPEFNKPAVEVNQPAVAGGVGQEGEFQLAFFPGDDARLHQALQVDGHLPEADGLAGHLGLFEVGVHDTFSPSAKFQCLRMCGWVVAT